ncbi:hypothetical protein RU639_011086 [Aspergillus parasiticus]
MILHYVGLEMIKNGSFPFAETRAAKKILNADNYLINNVKDAHVTPSSDHLDVLLIFDCCYAHIAKCQKFPIFLPTIDCPPQNAEAGREISGEFTQSATEAMVPIIPVVQSTTKGGGRALAGYQSERHWCMLASQAYSVTVVEQKVHGELVSRISQFLI